MAFTAGSDWGVNNLDFQVTKYLSLQDKRHDVCNVFLSQELAKTPDHAPSRTSYLFKVDVKTVARMLLDRSYKVGEVSHTSQSYNSIRCDFALTGTR